MTNTQIIITAILGICVPIAIMEQYNNWRTRKTLRSNSKPMKAGDLRIGDSFILKLIKNAKVWRIVKHSPGSITAYHYMRSDMRKTGEPVYIHPDTTVYFIRHTIPLPGEECFVEDLKPNDIITIPELGDKKWYIQHKGYDFDIMQELEGDKEGRIGRLAKVIYLGNKEKAKTGKN
ncbi:MAG: hypothetical protein ACT4OJ_04330 [Bacteroidota bacterium]